MRTYSGEEVDGVAGLEPANDRIKICCLANLTIPHQERRTTVVVEMNHRLKEKSSLEGSNQGLQSKQGQPLTRGLPRRKPSREMLV